MIYILFHISSNRSKLTELPRVAQAKRHLLYAIPQIKMPV